MKHASEADWGGRCDESIAPAVMRCTCCACRAARAVLRVPCADLEAVGREAERPGPVGQPGVEPAVHGVGEASLVVDEPGLELHPLDAGGDRRARAGGGDVAGDVDRVGDELEEHRHDPAHPPARPPPRARKRAQRHDIVWKEREERARESEGWRGEGAHRMHSVLASAYGGRCIEPISVRNE